MRGQSAGKISAVYRRVISFPTQCTSPDLFTVVTQQLYDVHVCTPLVSVLIFDI